MYELEFYTTLLQKQQQTDSEAAELLEEEVDILIHKLKFIDKEQRPSVLILSQQANFAPVFNIQITDEITIAGGVLLTEKYDNPSILLIIQDNMSLYSALPNLLQDEILSRTEAVVTNQIYIIQKPSFGKSSEEFLADIEIAAEIIQPKYFIYGRQGNDWVKFDWGN